MKDLFNVNGVVIDSDVSARMVVQIRAKQLATKSSQDYLQQNIKRELERKDEISGETLQTKVENNLKNWLNQIKTFNFTNEEVTNVGFPIRSNKTAIQQEMLLEWLKDRDDLVSDIQKGVLYNGLTNENVSQLPVLRSENSTSFWGNENTSLSTVLLYSVAASIGCSVENDELAGAATFYPFFSSQYVAKYSKEDVEGNPFIDINGVMLFGDYQFGGHRYFSSNEHPKLGQRLFSPEDCSSAIAKATLLTETQLQSVTTKSMRNAYENKENEYLYRPVTSSLPNETWNFESIKPGHIILFDAHVGVVYHKDHLGNIYSLEFNRSIDETQDEGDKKNKLLGGGTYTYLPDTMNISKEDAKLHHRSGVYQTNTDAEGKNTYILATKQNEFKESVSLTDLLSQIDTKFYEFCAGDTLVDSVGDCSTFLPNFESV